MRRLPRPGPRRDRGVSEVISVVLMVAVTIVLAAMVGSVLINVVSDVDENPLAGARAEFDAGEGSITVTYVTTQDPDVTVNVTVTNRSDGSTVGTATLEEVGDSVTFDGADGVADGHTYEVQVVAVRGTDKAVVLQTEGTV